MAEVQSNAFAYQILDVEKACKAQTRQQHQNYQYKAPRWRNNNYQHHYEYQPQMGTQMNTHISQMGQMSQIPAHIPQSQPQISQLQPQAPSQQTPLVQAPQMSLSDSFLTRQRSYQYEQPDTPQSIASVPADSKINELKLFDPFDTLTPTSTSGSFLSSLDSPALLPQKSQPGLFRSQTAFPFSESSRLWGSSTNDEAEFGSSLLQQKSSASNWSNVW